MLETKNMYHFIMFLGTPMNIIDSNDLSPWGDFVLDVWFRRRGSVRGELCPGKYCPFIVPEV